MRDELLAWYDAHRRDLPWRSPDRSKPDPYEIWISEVMLQQTRVETVKPYFERWRRRFPDLAALADSSIDDVLREWQGLGYYSRARNLHRAAREAREAYGAVPDDVQAFRALPGVGRYTAGAVMSIAFGRQEPAVDGNVRRVFSRLWDEPEPREASLWERAEALVRGERPGDLNQALMELGATVCTPRSPRCGVCPVAAHCEARIQGTQQERPSPKRRAPLPTEEFAVAVVQREGRFLLARRVEEGRLGGMWEFPAVLRRSGETAGEGARRAAAEGVCVEVGPDGPVGRVEHAFTHVRVGYEAVRCSWITGEGEPGASSAAYTAATWAAPADLRDLALPRAQQRIAALTAAGRRFSS